MKTFEQTKTLKRACALLMYLFEVVK